MWSIVLEGGRHKKLDFLADMSAIRGGGGSTRLPLKKSIFSDKCKKYPA